MYIYIYTLEYTLLSVLTDLDYSVVLLSVLVTYIICFVTATFLLRSVIGSVQVLFVLQHAVTLTMDIPLAVEQLHSARGGGILSDRYITNTHRE